jgi:hypothetical protein
MFWDGTRWVAERPAPRPHARPRRLVDAVATIPIILLVPLLLTPYLAASAAEPYVNVSGVAIQGGSLPVAGAGWPTRTTLQLTWDGAATTMPSVRTTARGTFGSTITVPPTALPTQHVLAVVAKANGNGRVGKTGATRSSTSQVLASVTVTVTAADSAPSDPPAPTAGPTLEPTARPTAVPPPAATAGPPALTPDPTPNPTPDPTPKPTPNPTPTPDPGPTLTFATECGGSSLDSRWRALFGAGDPGFGRDSDFMGNLSQVSVANGRCRITAERKATPSGRPYASACIATYGTFAQKYGIFEARVRYGNGQGVWPAFFLLPAGQKSPYPEVDIFEAYPGDPAIAGPGVVVFNVHYAGEPADEYQRQQMWEGAYVPGVPDLTLDYHVYRLVWTSSKVEFWLDGVLKFTVREHVPQVAMYPILNLAMGAPSYRIDGSSPDVVNMDIDYVRVWSL